MNDVTPNSGGTYRRNTDGSCELIEPPTGEPACPCRPEDDPAAPVALDTPTAPRPRRNHKTED